MLCTHTHTYRIYVCMHEKGLNYHNMEIVHARVKICVFFKFYI